jgi:cell division protein FtsZ
MNHIKIIEFIGRGLFSTHIYHENLSIVDFVVSDTKIIEPKEDLYAKSLTMPDDVDPLDEVLSPNVREILSPDVQAMFIIIRLGDDEDIDIIVKIAERARAKDIHTFAVVTFPFRDQGESAHRRAVSNLHTLNRVIDALFIIENEKLFELYPNVSVFDIFMKSNDIIKNLIENIAAFIVPKRPIICDFEFIRTHMRGLALVGSGAAAGDNRVRLAFERALNDPFMYYCPPSDVCSIIVFIKSGEKQPLKVCEHSELNGYIREFVDNKPIIHNMIEDPSLDEEIAVTIVVMIDTLDVFIDSYLQI